MQIPGCASGQADAAAAGAALGQDRRRLILCVSGLGEQESGLSFFSNQRVSDPDYAPRAFISIPSMPYPFRLCCKRLALDVTEECIILTDIGFYTLFRIRALFRTPESCNSDCLLSVLASDA